jgi:diacylglycerol kinase family enzyme
MAVLGPGPWSRVAPRRRCVVEVDGRPWFAGRASSVVVASGQYHAGADLVPRGHPGDGRLEVQVYAVPRADGPELRRRLPGGTHLPHPGIATTTGREIRVEWRRSRRFELDRERRPRARRARITVRPGTLTLVL